ncbi:MAG: glycoside hydrolase family 5 protein [Prolixibacteraceae bacterium]|jgi:endoglucanase|nr:glycoside hydrolase family 5 protein [Prolixibacteraceae bacterium]
MKTYLLLIVVLLFTACQSNNKGKTTEKAKTVERISVEGNKFVNENGQEIVFRGLNSSDPHKLYKSGNWQKSYFDEMRAWGANIVRFPVHPPRWNEMGKENYLELIDDGVKWAKANDMYVIIDWHIIGNLKEEKFMLDIYNTTMEETFEFWDIISKRYKDEPTVTLFELYNEPTVMHGELGEFKWEELKAIYEDLITKIRANGAKAIPLLAGFNWAYDLTPIATQPVNAENVAYVSHPYPQKRDKPWEEKWTVDWGFAAEKYPLVLSEIGFCLEHEPGAHIPVISDQSYGEAITKYSDKRGISYLVWVFDPEWSPMMFTDWEGYTPTTQGKFFKEVLQSY